MAHKIATGLKVPGLATVSSTFLVFALSILTMNILACRSSPVGFGDDNARFKPHMGGLGQVSTMLNFPYVKFGVILSCKRVIDYLQASSIPFGSHRLYTNS